MTEEALLQHIWNILEPVEIEHFEVVAGKAEPAALERYEAELGFALPEAFRLLTLSRLGGLYINAREESWPRAKAFDVGPAWTFWRGLQVFGLAEDIPEWLSLSVQLAEVRSQGVEDFAPVLKVESDPRYYGFRADASLALYDGYEVESCERNDFLDLLKEEVDSLIERMEQMRARISAR
ncbi:hypothetical protein [Pseudomonas sp. DP-17]|uniref:hypothetical protein n=1 Tax=Pseudomonas sp. DP-17 TaxID=1580486 RepID=UPI001EFA7EF2|nr:hypothetical protein [Pseudomonas sp. DP-17]MCG8908970.1 hypothetical protein [Pseudomonas sp. DP-17]